MAREIKLLTVNIEDEKLELNYKDQYLQLIKKPVNGMPLDEMEIAIRTISKLKTAKTDKVLLEEDEWKILSNLIKANKWALVCPEILAMIKNVTEATETKLELVTNAQA